MNIRELMEKAYRQGVPPDREVIVLLMTGRITAILRQDGRCIGCGEKAPEGHYTCKDCIILA